MICNSVGIILYNPGQSRYKITVLDKQHGRIECIFNDNKICTGSLIGYSIHKKQGKFFVHDVHIIYAPLSLGSSDVLFLHHVFELIYHFAPSGSESNGTFDLIAFLYTIEHMLISTRFKKFFLFKLLTFLGAYPEIEFMKSTNISQLNSLPVDQFTDNLLDEDLEKKLDKWLWCCIWQHPYVNEFKTVHFLEKNRMT